MQNLRAQRQRRISCPAKPVVRRQLPTVFSIFALIAAVGIVIGSFAVYSGSLHDDLHDASDTSHFCLVTLLGNDLVTVAVADMVTTTLFGKINFQMIEPEVLFRDFYYTFPPARAPPAFFSPRLG